MNRRIVVLMSVVVPALAAFLGGTAVQAGAVSRSVSKAIANKAAGSVAQRAAASQAIRKAAPKALTAAEKAELQRLITQLDRDALKAIEKKYAMYIPAERLRLAHSVPVVFKDKAAYQQYLHKAYPKIPVEERARMLGHYDVRAKIPHANINNPRLPRVVAHERIHQLGHPGFRGIIGKDMDEGLTEHFASKIYGDLSIKGLAPIYPRQRRIAEMISARVGPERLSQAYFQGNLGALQKSLDKQLGTGALAKISRAKASTAGQSVS